MKALFRHSKLVLVLMVLSQALSACKVSYSFSGVNIAPEVQSYSVQYFQNRAPIVQAQLSQTFTETLRIRYRTIPAWISLPMGGMCNFSGEITGYETRPTAITGNETAARNRLTITVRVKYTNLMEPELDFDTTFSSYEDYDATQNLADVENELITLIVDTLIEDIFNKAFISW